jgi:A/G-specific adenine glycosylase
MWRALDGAVRHVFTHFALELTVFVGAAESSSSPPENCRWAAAADMGKEGLPTLMQKVAIHAKVI